MLALRRETAEAPSVIVSVVAAAFPLGVSIAGLNDAAVPGGSPETLNKIGLANPFALGVAVS